MAIDITSVSNRVRAHVGVQLTGAPDLKTDYTSWTIEPSHVQVEYTYRQQLTEDGWKEHEWVATDIRVTGSRILKPAADGSRRLGKDIGSRRWYSPPERDPRPEWLEALVAELRPSGDVDLPGGE